MDLKSIFSGFKLGRAIALGVELLADVESLLAGTGTSFSFSWGGRSFTVNISDPLTSTPPQAPGKP